MCIKFALGRVRKQCGSLTRSNPTSRLFAPYLATLKDREGIVASRPIIMQVNLLLSLAQQSAPQGVEQRQMQRLVHAHPMQCREQRLATESSAETTMRTHTDLRG